MVMGREQTAATRADLFPVQPAKVQKIIVKSPVERYKSATPWSCPGPPEHYVTPGLRHSYCSPNLNSRPSRHRLNLKRCPWKLRRLRLHRRINPQIGESTSDDTAREPQILINHTGQLSASIHNTYNTVSGQCEWGEVLTACAIVTASARTAMLIRAKGRNELSVNT